MLGDSASEQLVSLPSSLEAETDRDKSGTVFSDADGITQGKTPDGEEIDDLYRNIRAQRSGVWDTEGDALGLVEAGANGLEKSDFTYVEKINADRNGLIDSEVEKIRSIFSERTGVINSDIGTIGMLQSRGNGVEQDSFIESLLWMETAEDGITSSTVYDLGYVYSGGDAISDGAYVHNAETIQAEGNGILNATVDEVGRLEAEEYGIVGDINVETVETLRALTGVVRATIDRIDTLDVTYTGLEEADVEEIDTLTTDYRMGVTSDIGFIHIAEAPIYENEEEEKTIGFKDCDIGRIDSLQVSKLGIEDSQVQSLGDVEAVWNGIIRSDVREITGDVIVENNPIVSSTIGRIYGDIDTDGAAITNSTIDAIYGDITAGRTLFKNTDLGLVAADKVKAKEINRNSHGNLIVADTVTTDHVGEHTTVITGEDDGFIDYNGEIDELKEALEEDFERLWPIQIFQPEIGDTTSLEELDQLADQLRPHLDKLDQNSRGKIQEQYGEVIDYQCLEPRYFSQVLANYTDELEELTKAKVRTFGSYLDDMDAQARDELINRLETPEENVGKDLYSIAKGDHFLNHVNDPVEELNELATTSTEDSYDLDSLLDDSPYKQAFLTVLEAKQKKLKDALAMAEQADEDMKLSLEKRLKKWEAERLRQGRKRDIDTDELEKELEKELDSKTRQYTLQALQQLGEEQAEQIYSEAFDKETIDDSHDEAAITMHELYIFNRDALQAIIEEDVYHREQNQEWLDQTALDNELLTNGIGEERYTLDEVVSQQENIPRDREYTAWVASPKETLRMGEYFTDSCFATGKSRGWHPAGTAADANKHVVYVENENGSIVARQMVAVTEDDKLSTYSTYSNTDHPVEHVIDEYVDEWSNQLGVETVEREKNVELLEAERWHDRAI